jgi:SAM-dependent methyltransferase
MLVADRPDTNPTVYLATGIEALLLIDNCADVVLCRNALDHMHDPRFGLAEMWRILKPDGRFFLSVDIGGTPTPDEPSPLERDDLMSLLDERFEIEDLKDAHKAHSTGRKYSLRILARPKPGARVTLDKDAILRAYERTFEAWPRRLGQTSYPEFD